ncbi:Hypothetical predicted protein [Paramuricea clavata]|uniref:Uncharacterized protein n=1 Tax=Paramuricea clavata TaxID=317549 RepID=A0A7D9H8M6_PARCT|nr:Hypothetical predicted protein [Paramuricea clavata]
MSILMGYDYFDKSEDLKKKVTEIEKKQQDNTAEIQKNKTELIDLSEVGRNPPVQIDLVQKAGFPPGFLESAVISETNRNDAKFIIFKVSGFEINQETQSPAYGFRTGNTGNVVMFCETQRSTIVRTMFTFFYMANKITVYGLKFRDLGASGKATVRKGATTLKCLLVT